MRALLVVLSLGFIVLAGCSATPAAVPRVCTELQASSDITGIGQAIDNVAPGHDYVANELQSEPVVRDSCPDQSYKLERYREQVINPVVSG